MDPEYLSLKEYFARISLLLDMLHREIWYSLLCLIYENSEENTLTMNINSLS